MPSFRLRFVLNPIADHRLGALTVFEPFSLGSRSYLLAGSSVRDTVSLLEFREADPVRVIRESWRPPEAQGLRLSDALKVEGIGQDRLLLTDTAGTVAVHVVDGAGGLSAPTALTLHTGARIESATLTSVTQSGRTFLAGTAGNGDGVSIWQVLQDWTVSAVRIIRDTDKLPLQAIVDMESLILGTSSYVIAASGGDVGLTSFRILDGGRVEIADSISDKDGLWVSPIADIAVADVAGQSFVLAVSPESGTLAALRVNPMGVFFVTDIVWDSLYTRFSGAGVVETVSIGNRTLVVTGGRDGGISVLELLPGGALYHHQTLVQDTSWDIGTIVGLHAQVVGAELQLLVAGARAGTAHMTLPLSAVPPRIDGSSGPDQISGTSGPDLVLGRAGDDRLHGGAGDDTLIAGQGRDILTGGSGADVFVFAADGQPDTVTDYELGLDRLDLSDWGRIYDISALSITPTASGASISWQSERVAVISSDQRPLAPAHWSSDDFIFV